MAVFWLDAAFPGRLAIVPRPRGSDWLDRDVHGLRNDGIDILVSLLTTDEVADLELTQEGEECSKAGIEFDSFPIADRGVPESSEAFAELANRLALKLAIGQNAGVHCRQGIGRSSLLAAATLTAAGMDPSAALRKVAEARGLMVPETAEQRRWFEVFARRYPPALAQ